MRYESRHKAVENSKGSITVNVLLVSSILLIGYYYLADQVADQKRLLIKNSDVVKVNFALSSTLDFVIFGVRQKYCFTDNGTMMNDTPSSCNLTHSGAVERLIMSANQEAFIRNMHFPPAGTPGIDFGVGVDYDHLSLAKISRSIVVSNLSAAHPLYEVLKSIKSIRSEKEGTAYNLQSVSVEIERDDSEKMPRSGSEMYLKVIVEAKLDGNVALSGLRLTSSLIVNPREVASFGLLIPNSLYLNKAWNSQVDNGDVAMHQFQDAKAVKGSGLIFTSPVFVNKDIFLPTAPKPDSSADAPYAAVTFADRVILGNGLVKTEEGGFQPSSAGGEEDRLWNDNHSFGGFQRGIEIDGGADLGLRVFAHLAQGTPPDVDLMGKCIKRTNLMGSTEYLQSTRFGAALKSNDSVGNLTKGSYKLYFDKMNMMKEQKISTGVVKTKSNWGDGTVKSTIPANSQPIMQLKLSFGNKDITLDVPLGSEFNLVPEIGSPEALADLQSAFDDASSILQSTEKKLSDSQDSLKLLPGKLSDLQAQLSAEMALPLESTSSQDQQDTTLSASSTPVPTATATATATPQAPTTVYRDLDKVKQLKTDIKAVQADINDTKNQITQLENSIVNQKTAKNEAEIKLNKYKNSVATKPEIKLELSKILSSKATFDFSIKNSGNFVDQNGELTAPLIQIKMYDNTYVGGNSINNNNGNNMKGYLPFKLNSNSTALVPPENLYAGANIGEFKVEEDPEDWDALDKKCEAARKAAVTQSFGGAKWTLDFSAGTRQSWNFAGEEGSKPGQDPVVDKTIIFDKGNSPAPFNANLGWPDFVVRSIVKECSIESTATIVTGFYTCDSLVIKARSAPLRIIGTFIVGRLTIDPSAYTAGIVWSSIYHPQATSELRKIGILHPSTAADSCDTANEASPVWHPIPSVQELSKRFSCNAISLRAKADPFRWTQVDPDCGFPSPDTGIIQSNTTCKHRVVNFFVSELSREE